jgi:hypothetical protein
MVLTTPFDVLHIERRYGEQGDLGPIMSDCAQELKIFELVSAKIMPNCPENRDRCPDSLDGHAVMWWAKRS